MISKQTQADIKEATTITPSEENDAIQSDFKIVYGPLLKYGVAAIGIVSVIVTTAVMTEIQIEDTSTKTAQTNVETQTMPQAEQVNDSQIDLKAGATMSTAANKWKLEAAKQAVKETETTVAMVSEADINDTSAKETALEQEMVTAPTEIAALEQKMATAPTEIATQAKPSMIEDSVATTTAPSNTVILAKHQNIMLTQDQKHLERLKLNHERQIETMRRQSSHQNSYLEQTILQLESSYLKQMAAVKRSQDFRTSMKNRI